VGGPPRVTAEPLDGIEYAVGLLAAERVRGHLPLVGGRGGACPGRVLPLGRGGQPVPLAVVDRCHMSQLWGSILQLTPHFHSWLPDGVFYLDSQGKMTFQRLDPPSDREVENLLARIQNRVLKLFDDDDDVQPDDEHALLAQTQLEAMRPPLYTIPLGPDELKRPRCAFVDGFSLHANLALEAHERKKLEKLMRYGLRPPFAQKRLSITADGKVRLKLRKPFYTGQTDIVFEPVDFLKRLASAIPKPRQNLVRFHGLFAPNAKHRAALGALLPAEPSADETPGEDCSAQAPLPETSNKSATRVYRLKWAQLLQKVFDHTIMRCPKCQGNMRLVQNVDDPQLIERILSHLGLPTSLPSLAPARSPPQMQLFDGYESVIDIDD
jgi:hypothetical protein